MGKLIFNAQSTPVAPVGASKHTMYVDSCDGKFKVKDSNDNICEIYSGKEGENLNIDYLFPCTNNNIHITTECNNYCGISFLCACNYDVDEFIVDDGVRLMFCGEGPVSIKSKIFCNMGVIDMYSPLLGQSKYICSDNIPLKIYNSIMKTIGCCYDVLCEGGKDCNNTNCGGGYCCYGVGEGGCPGDVNGKGGPMAGGGGGNCCQNGCAGNQETGIGGDGAPGSISTSCWRYAGGGGGRGMCGGGNGGVGASGGNSVYGNGGNGGGWSKGGDSIYGNGGKGGDWGWGRPAQGGNSIFGNGGEGGYYSCQYSNAAAKGGDSLYGTGGTGGANTYTGCGGAGGAGGNGRNGGTGGCTCANNGNSAYRGGRGGDAWGGNYGLVIVADEYYNNCILSCGGKGGNGGCRTQGCMDWKGDGGNGSNGGNVYVLVNNIKNGGTVNVCGGLGGTGATNGCNGINGCYYLSNNFIQNKPQTNTFSVSVLNNNPGISKGVGFVMFDGCTYGCGGSSGCVYDNYSCVTRCGGTIPINISDCIYWNGWGNIRVFYFNN